MRETMARYLGSRFAPATLGGGGEPFGSLGPGLPPELRLGDEDILGCEVGAGGGAIIEGLLRPLRPARPLKGSCIDALRLRLFW